MTVRQGISWLVQAAAVLRTRAPEHRSIVVIDMVGSGRWNDRAQLHARTALNEMVRIAFQETSIAWRKLAVEDGGDGMIVLVPATMSKVDLIGSVVPRLTAALREHNAMGDLVPRIRLRVAIHAGEVLRGPFSWVGADLIMTCRLVNGQPLYRQLKRHPHADLVLVVSDVIHRAVVRQGHRDIDPAGYTSVVIAVKEMRTRAWLHTPSSKTGRPGRRRSVRLPEMNCSALRRESRTALKPSSVIWRSQCWRRCRGTGSCCGSRHPAA